MEKKFDIEITTKLAVTIEDIDDIMCAALEGGITYWCNKAKVIGEYLGEYAHEQIARGGSLKIYDCEEDEVYELNREKLLNGIRIAREAEYFKDYGWWDGDTLDTCNVDAEVADAIIQCALFEDIVYG